MTSKSTQERRRKKERRGSERGKKGKTTHTKLQIFFQKTHPSNQKQNSEKKYPLRAGLLHVHCASSTGVCDHSSLDIRANNHENFQTRGMSLYVPLCGRPSAIFLQIFHIKGSLRSSTDLCGERHMQDHPDVEEE